jgi:serine/arginine repetitive matrix protein 2
MRTTVDAFRCHVSAISANDLESGSISPAAAVAALDLRLPANIADTARCAWRRALARCARHTLRSLSFPSHSGRYLAHGPGVDLEADTKRSVVAILAAGLPLPKSPSIHIEEAAHGPAPDDARLEREERGWWSLRFQQVMREMQRQDGE